MTPDNLPDEGVSLRHAPGKLALYALGGFGFAILGVCVAYVVLRDDLWSLIAWLTAAVPIFGIGFFGYIGLMALARMGDRSVVVHIGPDGILDARIAGTRIPWGAVSGMTVQHMHRQRFIMLDIDPAFTATGRLTGQAARLKPVNAALGFPGVALNVAGMDRSFDEIVAALAHYDKLHAIRVQPN